MKTKLNEGALYMGYIGSLYIEWLLEQEKLLEENYLMTIFETECDFASDTDKHPKLVPSLGTGNLIRDLPIGKN